MNESNDTELQLHCLVDREVDLAGHIEIMSRLEDDDSLRLRACGLTHQKELVRMAYGDLPVPPARPVYQRPLRALAASVVVALIGFMSYLGLGHLPGQGTAGDPGQATDNPTRVVLLDADGSGQQLADPNRDETRIVFQLTNPDVAKATEVLDEIEGVLDLYAANDQNLRVELVAHGEGLSHLRSRLTRHAERIADLTQRFDNLTFVACDNTIERISNEQGFGVEVLPQVVIIQSGVNHVAKRQSEGWAYIHL